MSDNYETALCLCGGGVTGAMYQVGCLAALQDTLEGLSPDAFDVYVGTASGATVATALAGEIPIQRMYRALLDPADDFFPLQRNHLLRLDVPELMRVFGSAVAAARRAVSSAASNPLDLRLWAEMERFVDSLPAGLFSLDHYERFLTEFMLRRGIPNRFDDLPRKLLVVANDLDAGERVVFGSPGLSHVRVARAVCASSALPILFAPVELDGRDFIEGGIGDNAHVDVVHQHGCRLVVIINPMVPVSAGRHAQPDVPTGHGVKRRIRDKGAIWVYNQSMRMRSEARLHAGLARFRSEHPDTGVILLEPKPSDATLFLYSPMNFAARRAILEEGYTSTRRLLREDDSHLTRVLAEHGVHVRP